MAFIHGRLAVVIFNGVDISAYCDSNEMTDDTTNHDVTCFGAVRKAYAAGLGDGQFVIGGTHDDGANSPRAVIKAAKAAGLPVPFIDRPAGTGAGKQQSSVNVLVGQYVQTEAASEMTKWKATLQMTGALDETNQ